MDRLVPNQNAGLLLPATVHRVPPQQTPEGAVNQHCGDSKPHETHEWWWEGAMPVARWADTQAYLRPTVIDIDAIRRVCPGTRRSK